MTDKEIEKLAREYAEANPPQGIKDEVLRKNCIQLNTEAYKRVINLILRTHCIVSKEKAIEEYEGWRQFLGTKDETAAQAAMWQLKELFGEELFNDDGDGVCQI